MQQITLRALNTALMFSAILFGAIYFNTPVAAQQTQITLSPTKQRIDIQARAKFTKQFTIYNSGNSKLEFNVYAAPYSVKSNADYSPVFSQDKPRTQISRWISFDQDNYTVEPGKSVAVTYHVTVPNSIPDGGQYAAIFAETKSPDIQSTSVVAKKRIGLLIYAKATGTTIEHSKVTFSPISTFQFNSYLSSTAKIKNSGNTDFEAKTNLKAEPLLFGRQLKPQNTIRTVLPDSTREIKLNQSDLAPIGLYRVTQSVTISGTTTSNQKTILVISPAILIVIVGIFITLIALGVRRVRRKSPQLGGNRRK